MTSFKLHSSAKINGTIPVNKYKSESTGLTLVLAAVEGPVVNGYFVVATEAHDDDGLPHTLEHLIFLGSEKYPYKGVLDMLANRCLSSGTNAWTDTDHTCYTMTTAGKDGFLELLPIYLDHVLYPTLSDAGFITEVHHVNGDGDDGGVVYCEMQGRENSGESRSHLQLLRAMYPDSGYSSETGGMLSNLQTSTSNEKIRKYHAEFYRPENLTIIIVGQVSIDEVTKSLAQFETTVLSKPARGPFVKPWQTPVKPLNESKTFKLLYPSDEEDYGLVLVGWRGPKCTIENQKLTACNVLLRYLSDTSVSPLQREFIEIADPYASQISGNIVENLESLLYFSFANCPLSKIDLVFDKLRQILAGIADGTEKIDMQRMNNILERNILEYLSSLENSPHDTVAFVVIGDILYGEQPEDFEMRLNVNKQLEYLQGVDEHYWRALLQQYFVDGHSVVVRAYPSIAEQSTMSQQEAERITKQRNELGENGLKQKVEELTAAMEENCNPAPAEMLVEVPIPSTDSIQFHPVNVYRYGGEKQLECGLDLNALPMYGEIYDLHTNFVYMIVSLNTDPIPAELRPYLLLFLELITESPIRRDDKTLIPYEDVVAALEKDTISIGTRLGLESNSQFTCGPYSHTATLMLQVEQRKYELGVQWLCDLLHKTEFIADRIKVCATKMSNSLSQAKRRGHAVVRDLIKAMYYVEDSNVRTSSMLYQQKFLNALIAKLNDPTEANSVVDDLNCLRDIITTPQHMAAHVAAHWQQMANLGIDINTPWLSLAKSDSHTKVPLSALPDWQKMIGTEHNPIPANNIKCGTVVGLGCTESSYLHHSVSSIKDFEDPSYPALLLFLQYLTQLEGPLWRQIRGQGFSYSYDAVPRPNEGLLYFTLFKSSNVVAAYKEAQLIIEGQLKSDAIWDSQLLESAKSSLIFEIIQREKCIGDLVVQSLLSSFKNVPTDYNRVLVKKINEVTVNDLINVGKKYVAKLFSPEAKTAIICHPDKVQDIAAAFTQMGRDLVVEISLEKSILNKC